MEKSRTDFMDSSFGDFFFFLSSPEQYSGFENVKPATEERNLKHANYELIIVSAVIVVAGRCLRKMLQQRIRSHFPHTFS